MAIRDLVGDSGIARVRRFRWNARVASWHSLGHLFEIRGLAANPEDPRPTSRGSREQEIPPLDSTLDAACSSIDSACSSLGNFWAMRDGSLAILALLAIGESATCHDPRCHQGFESYPHPALEAGALPASGNQRNHRLTVDLAHATNFVAGPDSSFAAIACRTLPDVTH